MRGSIFYLLYYKLHILSLNRGESYIDSELYGCGIKQSTTNPKNNDDKCFQYAITIALTRKNIGKIHPY